MQVAQRLGDRRRGALAAASVLSCSSLSERAIDAVEPSVAIWVAVLASCIVRLSALVAVSLASLIRRAICSRLSIIVRVKVKPLASIAFTAWSVTRLTSLANSWLLPASAVSSVLDLSSRMRGHLGRTRLETAW